MSTDGAGYKLPSDPDSGAEFYRICVAVPRRYEYLVAFMGALEYMGTWLAWERDEAHNGKVAAAVWKAANEITHQSFEGGECADVQYREKPGDSSVTQVSTDGENWFDIYRDCGCGTGTIPPDVSGLPEWTGVADAIMKFWFKDLAGFMVNEISLSHDKATALNNIMAILEPYGAGSAVRAQMGQLYDAVAASPDTTPYSDDCTFIGERDDLREMISENQENWLDQLADWMIDQANAASDWIIEALNNAAAAMGGENLWNFAQGQGGAGGAAGFGGDCESSWDFESDGLRYRLYGPFEYSDTVNRADCYPCRQGLTRSIQSDEKVVAMWADWRFTPSGSAYPAFGLQPDSAEAPGGAHDIPPTNAITGYGDGYRVAAFRRIDTLGSLWSDAGIPDPDDENPNYDIDAAGGVSHGPITAFFGLAYSVDDYTPFGIAGKWYYITRVD